MCRNVVDVLGRLFTMALYVIIIIIIIFLFYFFPAI